jgi:hypothetical protein
MKIIYGKQKFVYGNQLLMEARQCDIIIQQ